MANAPESVFFVNPYSSPVILKINGRANYMNSAPVSDFFHNQIESGKRAFVIDFHGCTGMDSTFLGIIAGVALEMRKCSPPGELILTRLGTRNRELVENLGLDKILTVANRVDGECEGEARIPLAVTKSTEEKQGRMILDAHQNLVDCNDANRAKFQDVISFLKNQVDQP